MTAPSGFPPGWAAAVAAGRSICARCRREQPAGPWAPGSERCGYCGGPLLRLRWQAVPPAGVPATQSRRPADPARYAGPPSYLGRAPRWGFPPLAWRPAEIAWRPAEFAVRGTPTTGPLDPSRLSALLRATTVLAVLLVVSTVLAAAAETWRFGLLLAGRTRVLPDATVRASNVLVAGTGWAALGTAVLLAAVAVPSLARAYPILAIRHGWVPPRPAAAVAGRLLVPGLNLWGAGTVVAEISALARERPARPGTGPTAGPARLRPTRSAVAWWVLWVLGGLLAVAALIRGFGRGEQAVADTVELHIALDLLAAGLAVLSAVLAARVRRALRPEPDPYPGWLVAAPDPTSDRGMNPAGRPG